MRCEVPVIFCADAAYGIYLPAVIESILKNASAEFDYKLIVFDCGIKPREIANIRRQICPYSNFSMRIENIEAWLAGNKKCFIGKDHISAATYARFAIPELCSEYDKVIYADIDMVFDHDIAQLMNIDIGDNYIAGVCDLVLEAERAIDKTYNGYLTEKLGIKKALSYVNAGLLVVNIAAWRERNIAHKAIKLLSQGQLRHMDQDAINSVCYGHIYFLDQRWNEIAIAKLMLEAWYPALEKKKFKLLDMVICLLYAEKESFCYHYAATRKPWRDLDMPKALIWWQYAA